MSSLKLKKDPSTLALFDSEKPECGMAQDFLSLVVDLTSAYISKNPVKVDEVKTIMREFSDALIDELRFVNQTIANNPTRRPAVAIEDSVHDDYLTCLEDGKKLQMLKRHLMSVYGMTVDQYKERWGLSPDYPSVAPAYARRRSNIAKTTGLGNSNHGKKLAKKKSF